MGSINQFEISRQLGSVAIPGRRASFGNMRLLKVVGDTMTVRPDLLPDILFLDSDDEVIVKAFERLRSGYSVDRFLADPILVARFNRLCKQLGLKHPPAKINKRLLAMRKKSGGSPFSPTTTADERPGLAGSIGLAVEFAMARVRIRYGATVDDILADPAIGEAFETFAREIIDGGTSVEYRLCALQIRKQRHFKKHELSLYDEIGKVHLEELPRALGTLRRFRLTDAPKAPGILVLADLARPMYLCRFDDLRVGARMLKHSSLRQVIERQGPLWSIKAESIRVSTLTAADLESLRPYIPLEVWELGLLKLLRPTFNYPVRSHRQAA